MSETFQVGSIISGKVTGIQPYGAFVALDENTQGLIHISEVTHGYVKDINEHIKLADQVKVKVLSINEETGKIGLSLRATTELPERQYDATKIKKAKKRPAQVMTLPSEGELTQGFNTLKEKLEEWIEQSQREDLIKNNR